MEIKTKVYSELVYGHCLDTDKDYSAEEWQAAKNHVLKYCMNEKFEIIDNRSYIPKHTKDYWKMFIQSPIENLIEKHRLNRIDRYKADVEIFNKKIDEYKLEIHVWQEHIKYCEQKIKELCKT